MDDRVKLELTALLFFILFIPSGIFIGFFFFEPIVGGVFVVIELVYALFIFCCVLDAFGTSGGTKYCSACGKRVSGSSRAGQRCPHCGAYWGSERKG